MKKFFIILTFFIASYNLFCQSITFEDIKYRYEELILNSDLESLRNFSTVLDLYSQGKEYNLLKKHKDYQQAFNTLNRTTKKALSKFESPWKDDKVYFSSKLISEKFYYFITIQNTYITKRVIFYRLFYAISTALIIFSFTLLLFFIIAKKEKQKNLLLTQALIKGQESERKRISEELHDTLAQNLKVQKIFILNTIAKYKDGENIQTDLDDVFEKSKTNISEIRTICQNLFPPDFENQKLEWIIAELCENVKKTTEINCTYFVDSDSSFMHFSNQDKLNLFRIIQEAVNNSVYHSGCKTIQIFITKTELIISDDGTGFNYENKLTKQTNHFGLRSIQERALLLNLSMDIKSNQDGTVISLKF